MARPPFSQRGSDADVEAFYVLREGIPTGLIHTLVDFAVRTFFQVTSSGLASNRAVVNEFARLTDRYIQANRADAQRQLSQNHGLLLDAVDFHLGKLDPTWRSSQEAVRTLIGHLEEARSVYTVGVDGDGNFELQHRQPTELTELVEAATAATDRSAEHLRRAWSEAFGRDPNFNAACTEAVSAIEAAAKPVVIPDSSTATLGTIIAAMRDKPSKWTTDSQADNAIENVIAMLEMVWKGHFRHGDQTGPIEVSKSGAEMVVQQAALLVHWFRSGFIRLA